MFYKQFSKIIDTFDVDLISDLDYWLGTIPENRTDNITASFISSKFEISIASAKILLEFLFEEGILDKQYIVKCPECDMIAIKIEENEMLNFLKEPEIFCNDCFLDYSITIHNIFTAYRRVKKPDMPENEITEEIYKRLKLKGTKRNFSVADSLANNKFDIYSLYYKPDESAYYEMERLFEKLNDDYGSNTTKKGRVFEELVLKIFKLIKEISGTNQFKTNTNQFDCTLSCNVTFPIPNVFNYLAPYFIVECKNEKDTPSNTYFHKLSSIMSTNEAKVGIIFSRKKASNVDQDIAFQQYLLNRDKSISKILLSFSDDDLELIIKKKENILKYLDFKILELTSNGKYANYEMFKTTNGE